MSPTRPLHPVGPLADLDDLEVLVLGLGDSGLSMARWCAARGARVRVWDSRAQPPQAAALAEAVPVAVREFGECGEPGAAGPHGEPALRSARLVARSPGLSPHDPRIAPLLRQARDGAIPIVGELDLFLQSLALLHAERGYAPRLLAVTGTNGKTTTTALTALLVGRAGVSAVAAGNIGPGLLDSLAAHDGALPDVWVLELSSFQLDALNDGSGFAPAAAVVLNLTQDHLDWHRSADAYAAAKARVFGPGTVAVVNRGDAAVEAMVASAAPGAGRVGGARSGKGRAAAAPRRVVRFGLDAPRAPGDYGLVVANDMAWLVRALPSDEGGGGRPRKAAAAVGDAAAQALHLQRLMPADALRLRGRHNAANALAALALCTAIGLPLAPLLHGLRAYAGEPHRVQHLGRVGGVDAYDDSKGTNVGATVAALNGLGVEQAPGRLVVVLGGDGKGQDFGPLAAPVQRFARAVATLGRDAPAIEAALGTLPGRPAEGPPVQRHATLEAATAWSFAQARPGDAVLLSPACASFDMFSGYVHRAEVFAATVRALAAEHGEVTA